MKKYLILIFIIFSYCVHKSYSATVSITTIPSSFEVGISRNITATVSLGANETVVSYRWEVIFLGPTSGQQVNASVSSSCGQQFFTPFTCPSTSPTNTISVAFSNFHAPVTATIRLTLNYKDNLFIDRTAQDFEDIPLNGITGSIAGPSQTTKYCTNTSLTYTASVNSGTNQFLWTVPSGWIIQSGQNTTTLVVKPDCTTSGNVVCNFSRSAASSNYIVQRSLAVSRNNPSFSVGSVPSGVLIRGLTYNFSVSSAQCATGYNWNFPGGNANWTILGQGSTSVSATPLTNSLPGNVTVTAQFCGGNVIQVSIPILLNDPPTALVANPYNCFSNISWVGNTGASNYRVEYKKRTEIPWTVFSNGVFAPSAKLLGLTSNTLYDWRVLTNYPAGPSKYTIGEFTTKNDNVCNIPQNVTAVFDPNGTSDGNLITASWSSVFGAQSYTVEYKPTTSPTWIVAGTTSSAILNFFINNCVPQQYQVRVRANCDCGVGNSSYSNFANFTSSFPSCIALSSEFIPGVLYTNNTHAYLTMGPGGYFQNTVRFRIAGSNSAWRYSTTTNQYNNRNLFGLLCNTTYEWEAQKNCGCTNSSFIAGPNFTTTNVSYSCNFPSGLGTSVSNVTTSSALISWGSPDDFNVSNFTFEYRIFGSLNWTIIGIVNYPTEYFPLTGNNTISYNLTDLQSCTNYEYRVKANCCGSSTSSWTNGTFASGQGNPSQCRTIFTGLQPENISSENNFIMKPNPASDKVIITYVGNGKSNEQIIISNAQGLIVYKSSLLSTENENSLEINLDNMASGMYFVKIGNNTKKLIITKN